MLARLAVVAAVGLGCGGSKRPFIGPQLESISRVVDLHYRAIPLSLDNGVVAFLLPDREASLVQVDARYRAGADADTVPGIAHLAEHLSYSGRHTPEAPTLARRLDRAAVAYNAFTSWESTHYTAVGPAEAVSELIAIEADRLGRPCGEIDEDAFAVERDVVRNEIRSRQSILEEPFRQALYPEGHRRRIPLAGKERWLQSLGLADVCEFIRRHYVSERLVLVISGRFDPAAVEALVRERFGSIPAAAAAAIPASRWPRFGGGLSRLELPISKPALVLAFPAPAPGEPGEVAGRLNASAMAAFAADLDDDHDWIENIYIGEIEPGSRPLYVFLIEVESEDRIDDARAELFAARQRYIEGLGRTDRRFDPTVVVLDSALQERRRELIRSVETLGGRAQVFADQLQFAGHPHGITRELRALSALTRQQVIDSAGRVLAPSTTFSIALVPGGREARRPPSLGPMMRRFDLEPSALAADAAAATAPLSTVTIAPPEVLERRLDNGLRVLIASGARVPLLETRVVFRHPRARSAIARASASVLSPDYDREYTYEQVQDLWATLKMGGRSWSTATASSSTFGLSGLAAYRDGLLWRLGWTLETGIVGGDAVREYNRRVDREPSDGWPRVWAALFGDSHPSAARAARVDGDQLRAFIRGSYHAGAATLIVVGALGRAQIDAQIDRVFGRLRAGEAPPPPVAVAPVRRARPLVFVWPDADRTQLEVVAMLPVPGGSAEVHARRVIAADMLEQELSAIRRQLGASYGFSASYRHDPSGSYYRIRGELAVERAAVALRELAAAIRSFGADGPTRRSQLVRARRRVVLEAITDASHPDGLADQLELVAAAGLPVDYWTAMARAAAATTIGEMLAPSAAELALDGAVVVLRGPPEAVESAAKSLGAVDVERVSDRSRSRGRSRRRTRPAAAGNESSDRSRSARRPAPRRSPGETRDR